MVCELHFISEPLYHHTWSCLNHYQYKEALFTAERILAENPNDDTAVHLLATCLYRDRGPKQAKLFLLRQENISIKSRFLLAKCNFEVGQLAEAEEVIMNSGELEGPLEVATLYKDSAPFVLRLLADIYKHTERRKLAVNCLKKCLELNPLSWEAFTELIDLHDNVDPLEVFNLPKNVDLNNQSCLRALSNKINIGEIVHHTCPSKKRSDIHDSQEDLSFSLENVNPKFEEKLMDIDEQLSNTFDSSEMIILSNTVTEHLCPNLQPELNTMQTINHTYQKVDNSIQLKKHKDNERIKPLFGYAYSDSLPTSYEFVPLLSNRLSDVHTHHIKSNSSPKSQVFKDNSKKSRHHNKRSFFNNNKCVEIPSSFSPKLEKTNPSNVSILSSNSIPKNDPLNLNVIPTLPISPLAYEHVKLSDNHTEQNLDNTAILSLSEIQGPRTRLQVAKAAAAQKSTSKKEYIYSSDECCSQVSIESDTRLQSVLCYLQLLMKLGRMYKFMKNFKLYDAISQVRLLPKHHSDTALVSTWLASVHIEMNDKFKACVILAESIQNEPWQLHGVPLFSSLLWLLNKEKELLALGNDMFEMDRSSPEVWCVYGNCMSMNKESEVAIRYFQRAIQLNPNYAYGYILLGHEYFYQDELDKALMSYRRAFEIDSHTYSATFYMASVYQKQDNYIEAESLLKEAMKIYPDSLMVLTNLAVIRSKLKQNFSSDSVLELLEKACRLYPNAPVCRFHKAFVLYHMGKYTEALGDLKMLETVKEARIYLLMSLIYKQLGQLSKAMVHNTWAMDLDPKCTNDSFIMDRNFVGSSSLNNIDIGNNSSLSNLNVSFLTGRRNSEPVQDEIVSNNQINYDLLSAD